MTGRKVVWIFPLLAIVAYASMAFAAGGGGHGEETSAWTTNMLVWRVIDGLVLIVAMVLLLKKPLAEFFSARKTEIRLDLEEAEVQLEKAQKTLREYEVKLAGMATELETMRAEMKKSAEGESTKVVANAERMANAMVETAKLAAEQEVRKAKTSLRNEAVGLAVEMAEALIREKITDDDRKRIVDDYLGKVGGMK
ncbi:MAG: ATP synthase F0 subunit B [Thermodesulfobacteriota bacterium]